MEKGFNFGLVHFEFLIDIRSRDTALAVGYISLEFRREIGTGNTLITTHDSSLFF